MAQVAANSEVVKSLFDKLITTFEQFATEIVNKDPKGLAFIDAFMAVYNFHKAVILDLERREPKYSSMLRSSAVATLADALKIPIVLKSATERN